MAGNIREKVILDGEEHVSDAFKKAGGGVDTFDDKLKKLVTAGGLFLLGQKLVSVTGQMVTMAIDAGEAAAAFDTTFGSALGDASAFVDEFANKAGFATYELEQMLAVTGNVVQGIGATEAESAALSESMARLAGDVASFSNAQGGAQMVMLALQSAINGEREALKTYGLAISEAEVQERAMLTTQKERADELTRLEKAEATVAIAYEKAGKAIGDLDRTQDSAANTLRRLQAGFKEAGVEIGTGILPALEDLLPTIEDAIPNLIQAGTTIVDVLTSIGPAVGDAIGFFDELLLAAELTSNGVVIAAGLVHQALVETFTLGIADTGPLDAMMDSAEASIHLSQAVYRLRNAQESGRDMATLYADEIADLQRTGDLTAEAIEQLAGAADLDANRKQDAIAVLIEYGETHGWAAGQIDLLRDANAEAARVALDSDPLYRGTSGHIAQLGSAAGEAAPPLEDVAAAEEKAAEKAAALREANLKASESFRAGLRDSVRDFLDGFEKAPEQLDTTLEEWEANFTSRLETQRSFWTNLEILAQAGMTNLAEEIRNQGPEAAGFLEDVVADMSEAAKLDEAIRNAETEMGQLTGAYAGALEVNQGRLYGDLETFGGNLVESIITGAEGADLRGALGDIVTRAVDGVTGTGQGSSGGGRRSGGGNFAYQSGTWSVPGAPGDASMATVHGTEIIIPPSGSSGRSDFARELAAEFAKMIPQTRDGGVSVQIAQLQVITPEGTGVHEAIAAGTAEAAIEALLS